MVELENETTTITIAVDQLSEHAWITFNQAPISTGCHHNSRTQTTMHNGGFGDEHAVPLLLSSGNESMISREEALVLLSLPDSPLKKFLCVPAPFSLPWQRFCAATSPVASTSGPVAGLRAKNLYFAKIKLPFLVSSLFLPSSWFFCQLFSQLR